MMKFGLMSCVIAFGAASVGMAQPSVTNGASNIHEVRDAQHATAVKAHEARLAEQAHDQHRREDVRKADLDAFHKKEAARHAYEAKHDTVHPKQ